MTGIGKTYTSNNLFILFFIKYVIIPFDYIKRDIMDRSKYEKEKNIIICINNCTMF
jgi:hypothetical protein